MPWKIVRGHVVNQETGQPVNKNPLAKARLQKLMAALYANVNHKESPTDVMWVKFKAANWGAKVGQNIIGRLFRGGGGRFQAGAGDISVATPVSKAVNLKGIHRTDMQAGLSSIDSVHSDGRLPKINAIGLPGGGGIGGMYTGKSILVTQASPYKSLTFTHEMGHFLDNAGFGKGRGFPSETSKEFAGFRKAVESSKAYKQMDSYKKSGLVPLGGNRYLQVSSSTMTYFMRHRETWARAYSQYIAVKSGNPRLLNDLRVRREREKLFHTQWDSDDFRPIEREIDKLMRSRGWLN